jgi:xanthine dehydrogenase YagR molybdenum-binding subunit
VVHLAVADDRSALHGLAEDEIVAEGGALRARRDPSRRDTYGAILARAGRDRIEGRAAVPGLDDGTHAFASFGAHFCEVAVDETIGRVRVTRVVNAFDVGRVMNPRTARSQVIGGVVMGIGMALMEQGAYDPRSGRCVTDSLADYAIPVSADVRSIETHFIDEPDPHIGEPGARGLGEIALTGVAAAIANAVFHATGRRVRDLPIVPERILRGL